MREECNIRQCLTELEKKLDEIYKAIIRLELLEQKIIMHDKILEKLEEKIESNQKTNKSFFIEITKIFLSFILGLLTSLLLKNA